MVSEQDQLLASNIAYVDFDKLVNVAGSINRSITLEDALVQARNKGIELGPLKNYLNIDGTLKDEYSHANEWVIRSTINENEDGGTGLYACIIDTGEANILACRGSEDMENILNYRQDWYGADMKLLNSVMTDQEEALKKYMEDNRNLLNRKPWVSTGHSLGGALADFAAICSVDLEMENYSGTYNFDGPGHSEEFIWRYRDQLAQVSGKMTHIKASVVGSMLYDLPGVEQRFIQTEDVGLIDKHSMANWKRNDDGTLVDGEQGQVEYIVEKLTRGADRLPSYKGKSIIFVLNLAIEGFFWAKRFYGDHPMLVQGIAAALSVFLLGHPVLLAFTLRTLAILVLTVVGLLTILAGWEIVMEKLEAMALAIVETICAGVKWLGGKVKELCDAIRQAVGEIRAYIHSQTPGAKYASSHPSFRADTGLLRDYASRLRSVNSRVMSLDRDMNELYWQCGFLDILELLEANIVAGYSPRISACRTYLNTAADTLDAADRKALGYMGG